jgi:hypothetical protein
MKTAVRAISQNIMSTKYNQVIVNTMYAYVKQFYDSHAVCVKHLYLKEWKNISMFMSISQ